MYNEVNARLNFLIAKVPIEENEKSTKHCCIDREYSLLISWSFGNARPRHAFIIMGGSTVKQKNSLLLGAVLLCIVMVFNISPLKAFACDCYIPQDALEGLEASDAVFTGRVIDIKKTTINGSAHDAVYMAVDEIWKGIKESHIVVYTSWSSCQFEFTDGEQYLLYSYQHGDKHFVMNCGRSTTIANGAEDIKLLGAGSTPSIKVERASDSNTWQWYTLIIVSVLALGAAFVLIRKYVKRIK